MSPATTRTRKRRLEDDSKETEERALAQYERCRCCGEPGLPRYNDGFCAACISPNDVRVYCAQCKCRKIQVYTPRFAVILESEFQIRISRNGTCIRFDWCLACRRPGQEGLPHVLFTLVAP